MKTEIAVEQLLRWRLSQAEVEAPSPPPAARLLELARARPWWETWPEQFCLEKLRKPLLMRSSKWTIIDRR